MRLGYPSELRERLTELGSAASSLATHSWLPIEPPSTASLRSTLGPACLAPGVTVRDCARTSAAVGGRRCHQVRHTPRRGSAV